MDKGLVESILSKTHAKKLDNISDVQTLWRGYGKIIRANLDNQPIIIKFIACPESVESDVSHERKIKSYNVEINWYQNFNMKILASHSPNFVASGQADNNKFLILEDLKPSRFETKKHISWIEIKLCLKWLANFHAYYLNHSRDGLWNKGTYWHLQTRQDEFHKMKDQRLKGLAIKVDEGLTNSTYKTLVHGDAKLANFLFSSNQVSAVDFQYVGGGVGVKDLAYFLSSLFDEDQLERNENQCLTIYFHYLVEALSSFHPHIDPSSLEKEWRELYPVACFDFYRFLNGWNPDHYKLNKYSESIIERVCKCY